MHGWWSSSSRRPASRARSSRCLGASPSPSCGRCWRGPPRGVYRPMRSPCSTRSASRSRTSRRCASRGTPPRAPICRPGSAWWPTRTTPRTCSRCCRSRPEQADARPRWGTGHQGPGSVRPGWILRLAETRGGPGSLPLEQALRAGEAVVDAIVDQGRHLLVGRVGVAELVGDVLGDHLQAPDPIMSPQHSPVQAQRLDQCHAHEQQDHAERERRHQGSGLLSALTQGWSIPAVARYLGLAEPLPPEPSLSVEINSLRHVDGEVVEYIVAPSARVAGQALRDLALPDGVTITLVVRDFNVIVPRGATRLLKGDHVFVAMRKSLVPLINRLFDPMAATRS